LSAVGHDLALALFKRSIGWIRASNQRGFRKLSSVRYRESGRSSTVVGSADWQSFRGSDTKTNV